MRRPGLLAAFVAGGTVVAVPALAQISPGRLSRPHAALDGSGKCAECHEPGRGVANDKCLACHRALQARIRAGKGLHARPEYGECKMCHIDHQGEEYELVWWGKAGRGAFDHHHTGYGLEGRHAGIDCQDCHKPALNRQRQTLEAQGVDLTRTYLGLETACMACHADEHRGQFAGQDCTSCHGQSTWKPAPGFDHGKTSYPLTGRHVAVDCAKCHKTSPDPLNPAIRFVRFKGVAGRQCASCHEDVHRGRLGASCATCHSTADWLRVKGGSFDHARTDYPLEGPHAKVECDRCHRRGGSRPLKYERCTDCHADEHFGQLAARADHGRCESCHNLNGFKPALYGIDEHGKTSYPLTGGHLAVACNSCHVSLTVAELGKVAGVRISSAGGSGRSPRLRFPTTTCAACHRDVHQGELDTWVKKGGCESCHTSESWSAASTAFDHGRTRYTLVGDHARTTCGECHKKVDAGTPRERVRFSGLPMGCRECHEDPHDGQFEASGTPVACDRCHAPNTLKASRFDHSQGSAWPLDGAHARVACAECHRPETRDGMVVVRYKPLPRTCAGCHGPSRLRGKEVASQ